MQAEWNCISKKLAFGEIAWADAKKPRCCFIDYTSGCNPFTFRVLSRILKTRMVEEALDNRVWIKDIRGGLSLNGLMSSTNFGMHFWILPLQVSVISISGSSSFSSKTAYKAFFYGSIQFEPWCRLWKSWAPAKCKMFLWFAIKNKCGIVDQLTKRGLPHQINAYSVTKKKKLSSIFLQHVCLQDNFGIMCSLHLIYSSGYLIEGNTMQLCHLVEENH